jgi:hypothetical protein
MPPCGWEVIGCDDCQALNDLDPEVAAAVEERAIARLWEWTNKRFGPCPVVYRPCKKMCTGNGNWMWNYPTGSGRYINLNCGNCGDSCSCSTVSEIILPGPIAEPLEILVDGVELELWRVRVDNYNRLIRVDGGEFPTCQDLGAPATDVGTWQITYAKGEEVPPGGGLVAGILACEYAKGMCGDETCRLPRRVSSITRQGITMAMLDNFDKLQVGFTGIWEIDDWIATYTTNLKMGPWQMGRVTSPDIPQQRFTTWEYSDS